MSEINLFSLNYASLSTTVTSSTSDDAFFPSDNIKDPRSTKIYRSQVGTTTASVVFDFLNIEDVDSILIKGSNISPKGFTGNITIEANATDSWGAPAFTTTLTYSSEFNFGFKLLTTIESYRFWRITGTSDSYVEFSKIFIGQKTNIGRNIDFDWRYTDDDISKFKKNRYQQRFTDKIAFQKKIRGNFSLLNKTQFTTLSDLYLDHGTTEPLWVMVDPDAVITDNAEKFAGMFYFDRDLQYTNLAFQLFNTTLTLSEAM